MDDAVTVALVLVTVDGFVFGVKASSGIVIVTREGSEVFHI